MPITNHLLCPFFKKENGFLNHFMDFKEAQENLFLWEEEKKTMSWEFKCEFFA